MPQRITRNSCRSAKAEVEFVVIHQADLQRLRELRSNIRDYQRIRNQVMANLDAGGRVETGKFRLRIKTSRARVFSFGKVRDVVGEEVAEQLRERIEPTVMRRVEVLG